MLACVGLVKADADAPWVAAAYLLEAELAALDGDRAKAEAAYQAALERLPKEPYLRFAWVRWLSRDGQVARALEEARSLVGQWVTEAEFWRLLGQLEWSLAGNQREGLERALIAFDRVASALPDDFEAWRALGALRYQLGDLERALPALEVALRLRPDVPGLELMRARALARLGRKKEAAAAFERVLELEPEASGVRTELAEVWMALEAPEKAVEALNGLPPSWRQDFEIARRLAMYRWLAGDLEGARKEASRLLEGNPDDWRLRSLLAWIERADGKFEAGLSWLQPLLNQASGPGEIYSLYFEIAERAGLPEEAEKALDRWLEFAHRRADPEWVARAWQARIAWDLRQGQFDRVLQRLDQEMPQELKRALAPLPALWAADAHAGLGEKAKALSLLEAFSEPRAMARALELASELGKKEVAASLESRLRGSPAGRLELAALLQRRERHAEALPILEELVFRDGFSGIGGRFRLGLAYERTGALGRAVETFESLLRDAPNFAPALNYLGYLWIERGERLEEAIELVRRAVRLEPDNAAYVDSLGWGYYQLGQLDLAIPLLERAVRLSPNDAVILEHLGDALLGAGVRQRALEVYRRALETRNSPSEGLAEKLKQLAEPR
jgi:tetratricopeptide (TPR) repeat protein